MTNATRSQEDRLAESIIERTHGEAEVEVHYNHYGDRGVVDLVISDIENAGDKGTLYVYELKSESALRSATGANEIIRQFNRQRDYFVDGSDYNESDYYSISHQLVFFATSQTVAHLQDHAELYETVVDRSLNGEDSTVSVRHPSVDVAGFPLKDSPHSDTCEWLHEYKFQSVLEGGE